MCVRFRVRVCVFGRAEDRNSSTPNLQVEVSADLDFQVEHEHWPDRPEDDPRARRHEDIGRVVPDEGHHSRCRLREGDIEHGEHEQPAG